MAPDPVSILLLGSGWTSKFVVPLLSARAISFARTRRSPTPEEPALPFHLTASTDARGCQHLPRASLVVILFPLSPSLVRQLVEAYERGTGCTPAWLALGSTGAWSKAGVCTSDMAIASTSERAQAENVLLELHDAQRRAIAVLNLSGLYGAERNPVNFAKRACETREKVRCKTSLHLVHGQDVARAIVGMYDSLASGKAGQREKLWGRRWIVTDTHVYDWWQLLSTLRPCPIPDGPRWVEELMKEHDIKSLPRPWPSDNDSRQSASMPPWTLERALDGRSFWDTLEMEPSIGRCDDYRPGGGGASVTADKESL